MSAPYIPFFVGDYIKDTMHLTTEQHGAYLLLIFTMFTNGGHLPKDDAKLARISRLSKSKWARNRDDVLAFFIDGGEVLTHKKITEVSKKYNEKLLKLAKIGARGGAAKSFKNKEMALANATQMLDKNPSNQNHNHIIDTDVSIKVDANASNAREKTKPAQAPKIGPFQDAINAQSKQGRLRLNRAAAWTAWQRVGKVHGEAKLLAAFKRYLAMDKDALRDGGDFQCSLQKWLNQKSETWLEVEAVQQSKPDLELIRAWINTNRMTNGGFHFNEERAGMTLDEAKIAVAAAEADGSLPLRDFACAG
jgi:uncharacterized protein YdaU (DUF1376 family)